MKTAQYGMHLHYTSNPLKLPKYYKTSSKDDAVGFCFLTMNLKVFDLYIFNIPTSSAE